MFFFFQAEDGIRYIGVTGVQTCALPIYRVRHRDGSWRWVADRARLVRDPAGRLVRLIGPTTDVTADRARREQGEWVQREVGRAAWRGRGLNAGVVVFFKKKNSSRTSTIQ